MVFENPPQQIKQNKTNIFVEDTRFYVQNKKNKKILLALQCLCLQAIICVEESLNTIEIFWLYSERF